MEANIDLDWTVQDMDKLGWHVDRLDSQRALLISTPKTRARARRFMDWTNDYSAMVYIYPRGGEK